MRGVLEADSEPEAEKHLWDAGLVIIGLKPQARRVSDLAWHPRLVKMLFPVSNTRISNIWGPLSLLLACEKTHRGTTFGQSLPLGPAIRVLRENIRHPGLRILLAATADAIEQGATLPEALEANGTSLSPLTTAIISDAETRGVLPEVLSGLARIAGLEKTYGKELSRSVTRVFLVFLGGIAIGGLLLWAWLPVIRNLQMSGGLFWPGHAMLWMIDFLHQNYRWVFGVIMCLIFAYISLIHINSSRLLIAKVCWHLLTLNPFIKYVEMARFCRYLGIIADSKIALSRVLDLLPFTTNNPFLQSILLHVRADILDGETLTQSLRRYPALPASLVAVIDRGTPVGRDEEDFSDAIRQISLLARYYEDQVRQASLRLSKATWRITLVVCIALLIWLALALAPAWRLVLFNMAHL